MYDAPWCMTSCMPSYDVWHHVCHQSSWHLLLIQLSSNVIWIMYDIMYDIKYLKYPQSSSSTTHSRITHHQASSSFTHLKFISYSFIYPQSSTSITHSHVSSISKHHRWNCMRFHLTLIHLSSTRQSVSQLIPIANRAKLRGDWEFSPGGAVVVGVVEVGGVPGHFHVLA